MMAAVMALIVFAAESFLTEALQGMRFDLDGQVGYEFVLNYIVSVTALGRPENSDDGGMQYEYTISIWDAETQELVVSGIVNPDSPIDDLGFRTAPLENEVTLVKGTEYVLVSTEIVDGDCWYDVGTGSDDISLFPDALGIVLGPKFSENNGEFPGSKGPSVDDNDGYVGATFYYYTVAQPEAAPEETVPAEEESAPAEEESVPAEEVDAAPEAQTEQETTAPQTSDNVFLICVVSVICLAGVCVFGFRKTRA